MAHDVQCHHVAFATDDVYSCETLLAVSLEHDRWVLHTATSLSSVAGTCKNLSFMHSAMDSLTQLLSTRSWL